MSEGISLGVPHQQLAAEYMPSDADADQALDDITERLSESQAVLSEGNETFVMIAAHSPESIPNDAELELLLQRIKDTVISFMVSTSQTDLTEVEEQHLTGSLESYREMAIKIKDKIMQAIKWFLKNTMAAYKRLSDGLGRLSLRVMYVERKIDSTSDSGVSTDMIKLPASAALLSLLGKPPTNASEVMNAVTKVKWLFTTIHNEYGTFQSAFKSASATGNRTDTLEVINAFLNQLTNRLNTRSDPQRNGRQVFNQLPGGYIVEVATGASFADCWITINRVSSVNVVNVDTRRPDRASLSRMIGELRTFLKVINELYGKVGSRLSSDFRNITRDAERNVTTEGFDARNLSTTIDWFTDQQNRLFYRTMVLGCGTIAAALDYCDVALRRNLTAGNEGLDDSDIDGAPVTAALSALNGRFDTGHHALVNASLGMQIVGSALEAYADEADYSLEALLPTQLAALELPESPVGNYSRVLYTNRNIGDYPSNLRGILNTSHKELIRFVEDVTPEIKDLIATLPARNQLVARRDGYDLGNEYLRYLLPSGTEATSGADIANRVHNNTVDFGSYVDGFQRRVDKVVATLSDDDILVSALYDVVGVGDNGIMSSSTLAAGWVIKRFTAPSAFGPVNTYRGVFDSEYKASRAIPHISSEDNVRLQETLILNREMDTKFENLWSSLRTLVNRASSVHGILVDSMARVNNGKADAWIVDGINYLTMLLTEVRWMWTLLHQMLLYRHGVMLGICKLQQVGGH